MKSTKFNRKFDCSCQEAFVPPLNYVGNLCNLHDFLYETNSNIYYNQATLTIGQLLVYNTTIRTRKESLLVCHSRKCQPPLSIYLAQMIHLKTQKLVLIDKFSQLGICISSDCLGQISTAMGNKAIKLYSEEGAVVPNNLRKKLLTTASVNNIDVNPKFSTAFTSLHGTAAY